MPLDIATGRVPGTKPGDFIALFGAVVSVFQFRVPFGGVERDFKHGLVILFL